MQCVSSNTHTPSLIAAEHRTVHIADASLTQQ